jgi:ADP-ribose pyrophosphatase YjhB (NUDIX family)
MCLSAFVLARKESKFLLGIPRRHERWIPEWISGWANYQEKELEEAFNQWRLPSAYLREGEHPDDTAKRVLRDQLGLRRFEISAPTIFSYTWPSDWYPGNYHWDLAFVYPVKISEPIKKLSWWKELRFVGKGQLEGADFGWNDDLMKDLKIT